MLVIIRLWADVQIALAFLSSRYYYWHSLLNSFIHLLICWSGSHGCYCGVQPGSRTVVCFSMRRQTLGDYTKIRRPWRLRAREDFLFDFLYSQFYCRVWLCHPLRHLYHILSPAHTEQAENGGNGQYWDDVIPNGGLGSTWLRTVAVCYIFSLIVEFNGDKSSFVPVWNQSLSFKSK